MRFLARRFAARAEMLRGALGHNLVQAELVAQDEVQTLADAIEDLGTQPGVFDALPLVEVVGWK